MKIRGAKQVKPLILERQRLKSSKLSGGFVAVGSVEDSVRLDGFGFRLGRRGSVRDPIVAASRCGLVGAEGIGWFLQLKLAEGAAEHEVGLRLGVCWKRTTSTNHATDAVVQVSRRGAFRVHLELRARVAVILRQRGSVDSTYIAIDVASAGVVRSHACSLTEV